MAIVDPGDEKELAARVSSAFEERYAAEPAVVARAPGRVNLIGEHTDYNRGLVLPVALPHATYAAVAPRRDGRLRFSSGQQDGTWEGSVATLGPGAVDGWVAYAAGVVWALREAGHDVPGLDVHVDGTVPLGSGLSSSAALECSVALAVAELLGLPLDPDGRRALADACVRAETEVAGAPTGGMDQTVALLAEPGTALLIDFDSGESRSVPLDLSGLALVVTDTRVAHELTDGGYGDRRADCERAADQLGLASLRAATPRDLDRIGDDRLRRRARHVVTETARVPLVVDALAVGDWAGVGRLFHESHASMRDDFEISTPELDAAVTLAVEAGALAARMTGGGFGGSSLAVVPEARADALVRAIDTGFVHEGFRAPAHLRVTPAPGATVLHPDR